MELFCALLTGVFLWLFLFHWHHAALARARDVAGPLLIEVTPALHSVQAGRPGRLRTVRILAVLFVFAWLGGIVLPSFRLDVLIACITAGFLELVFPPVWKNAPLELRDLGVIRRRQGHESPPGTIAFTPWEELAGCKWCETLPDRYLHARFLLLERSHLSTAQVETVTAAVGRRVPVFDVDGKLLAEPDASIRPRDALLPPQGSRHLRFQFNLQSLMLLMVVVSCAASCWGVHDRSLQPQREALAQLGAFRPMVVYDGDNVWWVKFNTCKLKPGDSDLIHLQRLRDLKVLDLVGAPVSDAGLRQLYPIKTLIQVSLSNTQVTQQGVEDLKRALPNASISWSPSPPPPVTTPVGKR